MKLGKIVGKVWAERKVSQLQACPLYIVQTIDSKGKEIGNQLVVADPQHIAGMNDTIVYVTNTDATQAFDSGIAPTNAAVVELVDSIDK